MQRGRENRIPGHKERRETGMCKCLLICLQPEWGDDAEEVRGLKGFEVTRSTTLAARIIVVATDSGEKFYYPSV